MIKDNPFKSNTFVSCWSKHFLPGKEIQTFHFTKDLTFYRSKFPGLYINSGKNLTKGLDLGFDEVSEKEVKGKTFLIYDVIDSNDNENLLNKNNIGQYSVCQYPGYLMDLESYKNFDEYLTQTFKKSSRYKLRKYKKRLEECFDISFEAYIGDMSKDKYDSIFEQFRHLLEKRFAEKQISNNNLNLDEWNFYKEVAYPMILENKATLFVLYNGSEPISITLAYVSKDRVFDAITVFDIDYTKFHLGSIKIMYLIDWCLKNGWNILDFSKGHFDYKERWANNRYNFYYHILFDKKSLKARCLAFWTYKFFVLKQYLREKNLNEVLHKFTYKLKNKDTLTSANFRFEEPKENLDPENLEPLDIYTPENEEIKRYCLDFLYLYPESSKNLKAYKIIGQNNLYLLKGTANECLLRAAP